MTKRKVRSFLLIRCGFKEDNGTFIASDRFGYILFGNVLIFAENPVSEKPIIVRMWKIRKIHVMLRKGERVFIGM